MCGWAMQELIKAGKATISTAIVPEMILLIYLINQGVESALSFTIMESVRKGKGLKPEWEEAMREKDVPEWYIDSCKKISYMFPKAHAAAYVMMAYRIAYCKVNYPLAYYAAYFSIRADAFSYELMCQGKEKLNYYIKDYQKRSDFLSNKEQDTLKRCRLVQEMYARGLEFMPIDLYRAKAKKFLIVDGKLMPSFASIEGMGEKAAEAVEIASQDGPYLSLDDFRQRTKVSKTVIDRWQIWDCSEICRRAISCHCLILRKISGFPHPVEDRNVHTQCKEHVRHRNQDQCVDCGKRQMREKKQDEQDDKQKRRRNTLPNHMAPSSILPLFRK